MNKVIALIMPIGITIMGSSLPLNAQPRVQVFDWSDAGIMGCGGQAAPKGAKQWGSNVYAIWKFGGENTVVMSENGHLKSYPYNRSRGKDDRTHLNWSIPGYKVEVNFSAKRTGYETSGGNGSMRIFSGKSGDSLSIPIRVDEGC